MDAGWFFHTSRQCQAEGKGIHLLYSERRVLSQTELKPVSLYRCSEKKPMQSEDSTGHFFFLLTAQCSSVMKKQILIFIFCWINVLLPSGFYLGRDNAIPWDAETLHILFHASVFSFSFFAPVDDHSHLFLFFLYFLIQNRQFYFDSNLYVKWSCPALRCLISAFLLFADTALSFRNRPSLPHAHKCELHFLEGVLAYS